MITSIESYQYSSLKNKQEYIKKNIEFICDQCGKKDRWKYGSYHFEKSNTFCKKCAKTIAACLGGQSVVKKYGKKHFSMLGNKFGSKNIKHAIMWNKTVGHSKELLSKMGSTGGKKTASIKGHLQKIGKYNAHTPQAEQKRWETIKKNNQHKVSKIERKFLDDLSKYFVIEEHLCIGGFRIDAFISKLKTYIQFDGIYWHGLDRPYADLEPRIKRKYNIDRNADKYFKNKDIKLVRITDKEYKNLPFSKILERIEK